MTDRPGAAGWYDDPDRAGVERWWSGTAWSSYTRKAPPIRQLPVPRSTRIDSPYIWAIVVLPDAVWLLAAGLAGFRTSALDSGGFNAAVILAIWLGSIVLAALDWRALDRVPIVRPFHWTWALLPAVYVVGRSVVLFQRVRRGLAPLVLYALFYLAGVAFDFLTSTR